MAKTVLVDSHQPERLRVGVVGGGWPGRRHAEAFIASGAGLVTAVADLAPASRAALAELSPGAHGFASAEELLAQGDVEAVVVALPTYLHRPVVIAALEAGKHVLCEKPPALDAREVVAMIDAARRAGRVLAFGLQRRALPSVTAARALIERGELGTLYHGRAVWTRAWGAPAGAGGWHRDLARAGGGPLIDLGVHVLDLAWWLMGRPPVRSVAGITHNRSFDPRQVEDAAFGLVRLADGGAIQLETSWISHRAGDEVSIEIAGTRASLIVDQSSLTLIRADAEGSQLVKPAIPVGWPESLLRPFVDQAANFAAAIRGEAAPLTPPDDALVIMRLIDGLYRSAREGREIPIWDPHGSSPKR
jgi:predicted dehydrogenase